MAESGLLLERSGQEEAGVALARSRKQPFMENWLIENWLGESSYSGSRSGSRLSDQPHRLGYHYGLFVLEHKEEFMRQIVLIQFSTL